MFRRHCRRDAILHDARGTMTMTTRLVLCVEGGGGTRDLISHEIHGKRPESAQSLIPLTTILNKVQGQTYEQKI